MQIVKNARLLLAGDSASLGVLSWVGYATGYLGNMLLLSYFTARREQSACFVQVREGYRVIWLQGVHVLCYLRLSHFTVDKAMHVC